MHTTAKDEQGRAGKLDEIREFAKTLDLSEDSYCEKRFKANWQGCADKGLLGLFVPEEFGGSELDFFSSVQMLEALGFGFADNGFTLGVNGHLWTVVEPILRFGTEEQKAYHLPRLIDGRCVGAHALTEEKSGSSALELQTHARKVDGGYVINGTKIYTGLGPVSDLLLTFASTDPSKGSWGISCFLIDSQSEGIKRSDPKEKLGLRTVPLGNTEFHDVFVPDDRVLGRPGLGVSIFMKTMEFERSFILASHVGSMARQLEETVAFAKSRTVGSQSISKYQSITNRIADMKVRLESSRMFLYDAARKLDAGQSVSMEAAMANLVISESFVENSINAMRIHGGRGYLSEFGVERDVRDALGGVIYSGTSDIQRNLIAGILGVR